jgi:DNA-directed RNA polymerase specialized sigma24 family protein
MAQVCLTKKREQIFTRCRRRPSRHRDMAPTPAHLAAIRRAVALTAKSFGRRLSAECVEDLVQETFLGMWKSKAEDRLDSLPYVRRIAANATIDLLRRQSAQKRKAHRSMVADLQRLLVHPSRTPEDVLIEREEALQLVAADRSLKRRVRYAMKQYEKAQAHRAA